MLDANKFDERRMHKRFQIKSNAFVANADRNKIGQIINISMGGFALRYVGEEEWSDEAFEMGIVLGNDLYMDNVPIKTIADSIVGNGDLPSSVVERRRRVKFGSLTPDQISALAKFIADNITAEA